MHMTTTSIMKTPEDGPALTQVLSLPHRMKAFFRTRVYPGFRIAEAAAWFLFHISWPLLLFTIFSVTGRFNDPAFMTLGNFLKIQAVVITIKAVYLLPFWWFFFIKLKNLSHYKKIVLHLPASALYTITGLFSIHFFITAGLHKPYPLNSVVSDIYNLMMAYFSHFALFHAYNFYLHIKEQTKKEQALKELAYQSEITALKAQIEPHFLFNTLNSISASVPSSLEKTRVLIAQLADTFRYALRVSERQTVALEEEITFVKTWLALEQHRLGKRLVVTYDIDQRALPTQVPSLILQPLIENAIEHGIGPNIQGGIVTVSCKYNNGFVYVAVCDTGVGYAGNLDAMLSKGVGLKNTAKRLLYLYNAPLQVERISDGLCFSFKIPAS